MRFLATFVGVGTYSVPLIRELVGATRDAKALHALFVDSVPGSSPRLLIDDAATVQNIRQSLTDTLGNATPEDTAVFFFSGHGSHDHRLAASDTILSSLQETTLSMNELADLFKQTKAKAVLCILDCCFSGGAPAKVLEDSPIPRDPGTPLEALVGEGRVILAASAPNEVAYELPQERHGLLTKALLDLFISADASIDLLSAVDQVMKSVRAEAARLGVTQTPVVLGSVTGGLVLPRLQPGEEFRKAFPEYASIAVGAGILELAQVGYPPAVVEAWHTKYPNGLNALQLEAVNKYQITEGRSLLVIAPTSAGKTFIGELAAAKAIADGRKAVFLLPYKALVNEKFDQFADLYGDKLRMRVIRCTGDYSDDLKSFIKGKYDIALLTYEMFLQLAVGIPAILHHIGLVVLDEAQFVTDPNRGMSVELLLTFLLAAKENGITPQLIALSAVIGDANSFNDWLGCPLLYSTDRPVPLTEGVIDRNGTYQFLDANGQQGQQQILEAYAIQVRREKPSAQDLLVPLVRKLVATGEKVLIFRNARGPAQGCAGYLAQDLGLSPAADAAGLLPTSDLSSSSNALRQCLMGGTAFHNSNLTREERVLVEQAFRDPKGPVRVLVATTTVAAGINTPASTVVLAENEFVGEDGRPFTVAEYKNMAGRAGRLGFNEQGKSIIYAETPFERQALYRKYVLGQLESLHSSFDPRSIETWLVRLLAQVESVVRTDVVRLLVNTYGGYLEVRRNPAWRADMERRLDQLLVRMIQLGLVDQAGDRVSLTLLGSACGNSSLSFDAAMRLVELVRSLPQNRVNATNLIAVMQALPEEELGYTPLLKKGTREAVRGIQAGDRFGMEILPVLQRFARDLYEYYARCKRAAILYDWIAGRSLEEIEREFSTTPYAGRIEHGDIRRFADSTRFHLRSASDILSILLIGQHPQEEIDAVLKRLEVGIPSELLDLLKLPLPLTRGEYLVLGARNILTVDQFWVADPTVIRGAIGDLRFAQFEKLRPRVKAQT